MARSPSLCALTPVLVNVGSTSTAIINSDPPHGQTDHHSLPSTKRFRSAPQRREKKKGVHGGLPRRRRGAPLPRRRRRRRGGVRLQHHGPRPRRRPQLQRPRRLLGPVDQGQGHLVRPAQRRRPRRQRWCLRLQAHQQLPLRLHDLLRQPAIVQGRQGMRLLLQDQMPQGPLLLRQGGDGGHHRHELLPSVQVPLRPQRHGVRQARQAGAQREAPPLRYHRHRVHQGAVRVPRAEDRVPRGGVLEPRLLRGAGGVRGHRRRRGAGGPHGVQVQERPAHRPLDADAGVVGLHLAARLQPQAAGAILHPHPQRVRQDAHRQAGHPGQLEAQHILPILRAVPVALLLLQVLLVIASVSVGGIGGAF